MGFSYLSYLSIALSVVPLASAHIAPWNPAMFNFNDGYGPVTPLAGKSFNEWWFHGNLDKPPAAGVPPVSLPVGGAVTMELACEKKYTSYGNEGDGQSACPNNSGPYHAGEGVQDDHLLGCALAIAYKSDPNAVQPQDFTVFSVNYDCVKQLKTSFQIPAEMPACPEGGCVCSWFWQGQDSDNEMYMTGFLCNVEGGSTSAPPAIAAPPIYCSSGEGCVTGPKQPMYWANNGQQNVEWDGDYFHKPSYNMKWGFSNGAQPISGGTGRPPPNPITSTPEDPEDPEPSPSPGPGQPNPDEYTPPKYTPPETGDCTWAGHCAGAPCATWDDCSDVLTCNDGVCGNPATYRRSMRYKRY